MAGGSSSGKESQFKGLSKYFNTITDSGRRNITAATYSTVALIALYFWARSKRKSD
ncbi:Uncharacterised protein g10115 [Pycnogonum litorale]